MSILDELLTDLRAEGDQLRTAVQDLDDAGWTTPTPAPGWTVATQVAHLAWTDETAVLAAGARTPEGKEAWDAVVLLAIEDPTGFVDREALRVAELPPAELLSRWDAARAALTEALSTYPAGERMPWFGPPMSPASMATARFMETWAHALDVYDALGGAAEGAEVSATVGAGAPPCSTTGGAGVSATVGAEAPPCSTTGRTDRIRHVAHLGVRTRDFAYSVHGEEPPAEPFRVQLTAPSGDTWAWGPEDAQQTVTGSAYDFCLLVTQRVHRDDTDLVATGEDAEHWLTIAQAFAGPPGEGRTPEGERR